MRRSHEEGEELQGALGTKFESIHPMKGTLHQGVTQPTHRLQPFYNGPWVPYQDKMVLVAKVDIVAAFR